MNPFDRLAPFIQEYIWAHDWDELRDVQVRAIDQILDTPNHVLIAAGTASGKTEAAFFPMLSMLAEAPARDSFGILYIGPLKALINDQFERIRDLLEQADFPIFAWHGDRAQSEKRRAMAHPRGVLQITPEALEGLLMNHAGDAARMFAGLEFVVIDELHAFMGADRGLQLQCLLARIDGLIGRGVRRVGLSATIHDCKAACAWLSAGTPRACSLVESLEGTRRLELAMEHYALPQGDEAAAQEEARLYDELYGQARGRKCLIFTASRAETEAVVVALRERAKLRGEPDCFHAHHGSISSALRAEAEAALRGSDAPAVAVATRTLELGIDLGGLERVLQLGSPGSCSSFVQRLGRTGRRSGKAVMRFLTRSSPKGRSDFEDLPWELIESIAIIQLYIEERWVESAEEKPCPYSVLFHQTLSILMGTELSPRALARRIYAMPAFAAVPQEDYLMMLRHMVETDALERTEAGTLIPGLRGERLAGNYRFLSVFTDDPGYRVLHLQREIGELDSAPKIDETILLAGRRWRATQIDEQRRVVYVVPSEGRTRNSWSGGGIDIDDRIAARMRQVLTQDADYPYLLPGARAALKEARAFSAGQAMDAPYTVLGEKRLLLHPWLGSRKMRTLLFLLREMLGEALEVQAARSACEGMAIEVDTELGVAFWQRLLDALREVTPEQVIPLAPPQPLDRYDPYLPPELLQRAYVLNHLDVEGLRLALTGTLFPMKPSQETEERK